MRTGPLLSVIIATQGRSTLERALRSIRDQARVMNVDVGGGTAKVAVCADGKVADVTAIDIGARLIVFDQQGARTEGRVTTVSDTSLVVDYSQGRIPDPSLATTRTFTPGDVRRVLKPLEAGRGPAAALEELRRAFGLGRVVLRDADERVLAVAPDGAETSVLAAVELNPDTLFALGEARYRFGDRGLRLPEGGGCLRVTTERGEVALHLWEGDAHGLDEDERQALGIAASVLGVALARQGAR